MNVCTLTAQSIEQSVMYSSGRFSNRLPNYTALIAVWTLERLADAVAAVFVVVIVVVFVAFCLIVFETVSESAP